MAYLSADHRACVAFVPMGPGQQPWTSMCFSANASFTASAILATAGTLSVSMGRRNGQWAFACIPLIFAVQQLIEGFVWIGLSGGDPSVPLATLSRIYLVFAQVLWPVWVPSSVLLMEKDERRRRWLSWTLVAGIMAAAYHAWSVFATLPQASIDGQHIHYTVHYPWRMEHLISLFYFVATVVSVYLSGLPRMWILGAALLISYAVARIAFPGNVISVWCYFAALISTTIIYLLYRYRASHRAQLRVAPLAP